MSSLVIAGIVFAAAFGGALVGLWLQRLLPSGHLAGESKDVIKLGTGLIATMAALVLGLLVGSAKSSFDAQESGFQQLAANVVVVDRALEHFGPEAKESRDLLKQVVASMLASLWPESGEARGGLGDAKISAAGNSFYDALRSLAPKDDAQRTTQSQALSVVADIARTKQILTQTDNDSLPLAFLAVLAFWLFVLFASFGLFAPRNATVIAVLLLSAMSVAGAVFLIVDMDQPFEGVIQISSTPLKEALAELGK